MFCGQLQLTHVQTLAVTRCIYSADNRTRRIQGHATAAGTTTAAGGPVRIVIRRKRARARVGVGKRTLGTIGCREARAKEAL